VTTTGVSPLQMLKSTSLRYHMLSVLFLRFMNTAFFKTAELLGQVEFKTRRL